MIYERRNIKKHFFKLIIKFELLIIRVTKEIIFLLR